MTLLFIDTERDQKHRIIQIGIAVFDEKGELKDTFKKLINTGVELTSHIERLTGIKTKDLSKEISPHEANKELNEFLEKNKKEGKEKLLRDSGVFKGGRSGSNRRPSEPQSDALTY